MYPRSAHGTAPCVTPAPRQTSSAVILSVPTRAASSAAVVMILSRAAGSGILVHGFSRLTLSITWLNIEAHIDLENERIGCVLLARNLRPGRRDWMSRAGELIGLDESDGDPSLPRLATDLAATGATVLTLGDVTVDSCTRIPLPPPDGLTELAVGAVAVQELSVELARGKGIVPEEFRFGRKIMSAL